MKRILLQSMLSIGCLATNFCLAVDTPKAIKNAKDAPTAKIEAEKAEKQLRIVSRIDVEPVVILTRTTSHLATSHCLKMLIAAT